ncbi:hypothetical protein B9Z55_020952 [Caenorhabditis nigoni]|uniref:Nuclear receptor domain-containing protein n=1 Tax=Caenorhabditis nigoni TaxID=1611254 RepID=A0A2G5TPW6_9PELO|nr:hypothetical protein B9Z55_020952 [Caenorhabditis nigoni]
MTTKCLEVRPTECSICYRPAHQHHCGVPTCKGCKTFFRRMYISRKIDKCQFDENCFDKIRGGELEVYFKESIRIENSKIFILFFTESIKHLRCQYCRFQKCIQVGMNAKDLRLPEAESPITLTTPSDNLPLLLKQMAHLDAHRTHLIQNCSYDGDPTIEEISCMNQNLNFRCSPLAHDLPSLEWAFFTALASFDYLKKLQIVQNLDIKDRSILLKQAFSTHSLLSEGFDAFQKKQSCLTFPNGSDCFLSEAITVPADFENRIRCRLVGRMCDLKMTYEEKLLLSVIFTCDPALNGLSERGQSLSSSHRNVYTSLLVQYCLQTYQKLGPSRFVDLLSIYDAIKKTQEDLSFHYILCYLNNPPLKLYKIWLSLL